MDLRHRIHGEEVVEMRDQISIYDLMPYPDEPDLGTWVDKPGAVIDVIILEGYIGKKVLVQYLFQGRYIFKVCLGEKVRRKEDGEVIVTWRDGGPSSVRGQWRSSFNDGPLHECLPWDQYEKRRARYEMG